MLCTSNLIVVKIASRRVLCNLGAYDSYLGNLGKS